MREQLFPESHHQLPWDPKNNQVFHAGTYVKNNKTYSSGGRVLNITSLSESLIEARNKSLNNIDKINWSDGFFRKDIGWREINNK